MLITKYVFNVKEMFGVDSMHNIMCTNLLHIPWCIALATYNSGKYIPVSVVVQNIVQS